MSVTVEQFAALVAEQKVVFERLARLLAELAEGARAKDGVRVATLTPQLQELQVKAADLDERIRALAAAGAAERGIPVEAFKLSAISADGAHQKLVDESREAASAVARQASQAAGVLSANVSVIEETLKVLENIDAKASAYGPDLAGPRGGARGAAPGSKLFDHSA